MQPTRPPAETEISALYQRYAELAARIAGDDGNIDEDPDPADETAYSDVQDAMLAAEPKSLADLLLVVRVYADVYVPTGPEGDAGQQWISKIQEWLARHIAKGW